MRGNDEGDEDGTGLPQAAELFFDTGKKNSVFIREWIREGSKIAEYYLILRGNLSCDIGDIHHTQTALKYYKMKV